ncbi:MAG: methyltransferase domain-containing protein [Candidatus Omnitrophota bacterium]|nr:methyltransferase domain-containing protein [Candidatus Omnitrophota bacterium]
MKQSTIDYKNFKVEVLGALYDCGNRLRRRKMLSLLPDIQERVVLEIGCGIGDFAIALNQKRGAYKKYIGIDISFNNLLTAKQLINEAPRAKARSFLYPLGAERNPDHASIQGFKPEVLSRRDKFKPSNDISLAQADIFRLPFKDESIDILICAEVLEHLDDIRAMKEIKRVLKKESFVLITMPYLGQPVEGWGHLRHYDLETIKNLANGSDFIIRSINIFGRFHEISWVRLKRILFRIWGVWKKITRSKNEYYASRLHRNFIMPIGDRVLFIDDLFAQSKSIIGSKGYVVVLLEKK